MNGSVLPLGREKSRRGWDMSGVLALLWIMSVHRMRTEMLNMLNMLNMLTLLTAPPNRIQAR
jgi:hypothetical protein